MNRVNGIAVTGEHALILAAERLFAERGIDAVSLRQINQAANQKNMSAAHYHFSSREGLVEAVLMYRLPTLDHRRDAMLAKAAHVKDLRFFLEAFIVPLIDELKPRQEGNYYLRFIQQYERYRGSYDFARELTPAGVEIYAGLENLIGYLPGRVRRLRIGSLINIIHAVLATAEERLGTGEMALADIDLIAANVIDMIAAAMVAPLSVQTLGILGGH